ncbi:hypothetical protein FBALC1_17137 [Flavobacteriales bacterium ALC-1]|nr:hypothetical protein FBALC1_17137 [Flavobacteriales bacterium ALC-1]
MIVFDKDYELGEDDLNELELVLEKELPEDYKAHMKKYNGGSIPSGKEYFFSFRNKELVLSSLDEVEEVKDFFRLKKSFLYPKLLSIGTLEGGYLAIGYVDDNYGEIYAYHSDQEPYKISNSFAEFIEELKIRGV